MTLFVQQKVFGLEIAIDDVPFMQVVEGTQDPSGVKLRVLLAAVEA